MTTTETAQCPYCQAQNTIVLPINYAPVFFHCDDCQKKFIVERRKQGFDIFTEEGAPRCSNPDFREIEMAASDEQ